MTSISANAAATAQDWVTRQWTRAEQWYDKGEPETPQVTASLVKIWQGMVRFEAVERSLRRTGFTGCIAPERGCGEQAISCTACAERGEK